jgi:hypothetical protein
MIILTLKDIIGLVLIALALLAALIATLTRKKK